MVILNACATNWPHFPSFGRLGKNLVFCCVLTVWKFHNISITQILREINFGGSRSSKNAICAISEALNCIGLVNFSIQKVQKSIKVIIQSP